MVITGVTDIFLVLKGMLLAVKFCSFVFFFCSFHFVLFAILSLVKKFTSIPSSILRLLVINGLWVLFNNVFCTS